MPGEDRGTPGKLTVRLLGPLEVTIAGRRVVMTSGRLRTVLAVLAMSAGQTVSVDRLAAAVWDEVLPDNTKRSVQTYVARLRGMLGARSIGTTLAGYALRTEPDDVDAIRFVRLLQAAAGAQDRAAERDLLADALELWRGTPFDGVQSDWLEHSATPWLVERYLAGLERRIDLDLADGQHGELVAELGQLTAQHPLREPLWLRLLVALHRCGRPAEALERYETIRKHLAEELGTDPAPELQEIHAGLLAGMPSQPARIARPAPADRPVPRQLPADIDGFTGRVTALKELDHLLQERNAQTLAAVVISAITGTAGVGKTALAVHWTHRIADRFPDGQLYVNLRGFHPSEPAMAPAETLRRFFDALGVPPERIPPDLDAQAGLYRSLLSGKRVMVLLDNARDADQVRPLLPGSAGCLVVVTSRNLLSGLVTTGAARPLVLDLLPVDEARELLGRRLGAGRVAAEPEAVDEIITRCARLPLALAIVAAHAASHPSFPLRALAPQLRGAQSGLDAFRAGEAVADARTVFSWSYRALGTDAARLFRLLGLHAGPDLTAPAAASLAGLPPNRTRLLLADLTQAHLLAEHAPGRYSLHDLLRTYATELGHTRSTATERKAACHRMLDHYLHSAHTAARRLNPSREHLSVKSPQLGVTPEDIADYRQALGWFTAEHPVLRACIGHAAEAGFDTHTWQLAWTLDDFHYRHGHWQDSAAAQLTALEAALRLADRPAQARAHRALGAIYTRLGRLADAHTQLRLALQVYDQVGDEGGQVYTHMNLAIMLSTHDPDSGALRHAQHAIDQYLATGHHPAAEEWDLCSDVFQAAGWCHAQLGDYQQALSQGRQGLALNQEIGNRDGEARSWHGLGHVHHDLGDNPRAIACFQRAIDIFHDISALYHEADARICLGDTHRAAGAAGAARAVWQDALTALDGLGHRDAEKVRAKLQQLDQAAAAAGDRHLDGRQQAGNRTGVGVLPRPTPAIHSE